MFDPLSVLGEGGLDYDKLLLVLFDSYDSKIKKGSIYNLQYFNPQNLIKMYYNIVDEPRMDGLMTKFKRKYIQNESQLELVHDPAEVAGLGEVYEYIHTFIETPKITVYTIVTLHRLLFSKTPFPEAGGNFRNRDVYLPGTGIDLVNYSYIIPELQKLFPIVNELVQEGIHLGKEKDIDEILEYIQKCIKINVEIIRIHPFIDGNGRTARAFLNLLFKLAGIPPVYVKPKERLEYQKAMNRAIVDQDYSVLSQFYFYKICDSIYELDVKERINKGKQELKQEQKEEGRTR